jgi:hypothetical protein
LLLALIGQTASAFAQTTVPTSGTPATSAPPSIPDLQTPTKAIAFRAKLVTAIVDGTVTADNALTQLNAQPPSGDQQNADDSGYANAAIDVGLRLLVEKKQEEAALFFKSAETALTRAIDRTPDSSAAMKAQALGTRAFVRARFLNLPDQAKADLAAAQVLTPGDANLQVLRTQLAQDNPSVAEAAPNN